MNIRAAQGHQLLPRDFKPGLFEAIVVRPRPDAAKLRPFASPTGFGACSGPSRSPIPRHRDHPFQSIVIADSTAS